jgi:hypothetical protein
MTSLLSVILFGFFRGLRHAADPDHVSAVTGLALTGVRADLAGRRGDRPTFALIGELDALAVAGHPDADPTTGAVHACGHNAQIADLLGAAIALVETGAMDHLAGRVALVAAPAEEGGDLDDVKHDAYEAPARVPAAHGPGEPASGNPAPQKLSRGHDVERQACLTHGWRHEVPPVERQQEVHGRLQGCREHVGILRRDDPGLNRDLDGRRRLDPLEFDVSDEPVEAKECRLVELRSDVPLGLDEDEPARHGARRAVPADLESQGGRAGRGA